MPTRMTKCRKEKAVLVAVYVEGPRRRRLSSNNNNRHHHHHQHQHLYLHQSNHGKGHNRRAELLDYSRRLRESARSGAASTIHPKPPNNNQQPMTKIFTVQSKPEHGRGPTCLGNCKILIPSFLRRLTVSQAKKDRTKKKKKKKNSESTATKMKAFMKSFQVQKKEGFISKVFATIQKHR